MVFYCLVIFWISGRGQSTVSMLVGPKKVHSFHVFSLQSTNSHRFKDFVINCIYRQLNLLLQIYIINCSVISINLRLLLLIILVGIFRMVV